LFLFLDEERSHSFLDHKKACSIIAVGAATENLRIKAASMQLQTHIQHLHFSHKQPLAVIHFTFLTQIIESDLKLVKAIELRSTNRKITEQTQPIEASTLDILRNSIAAVPGAQVEFLTKMQDFATVADVVGGADRLRLLHPWGHSDFMQEVRWTPAENEATRDGINIATLELPAGGLAGLKLASDWSAVKLLAKWQEGKGLEQPGRLSILHSGAVGLIHMPSGDHTSFFEGGRAVQRLWLEATNQGIAFQPLSSATSLFARLQCGEDSNLPQWMQDELSELESTFNEVLKRKNSSCDILLFRLFKAEAPKVKSMRLPLEKVLSIN